METNLDKNQIKHNYTVNVLDGAFYGLATGFASFGTIIPLFIASMTNSAILIGLVPALHNVGWQLPQLFFARTIGRYTRLKPLLLALTTQDRLPFLVLGLIAWFLPVIGNRNALILSYIVLIWQGLGSGFAANPWQNLIGRIIPFQDRATFFGVQSAAASLLASLGAMVAGYWMKEFSAPTSFAVCFFAATVAIIISYIFLALTRENRISVQTDNLNKTPPFWQEVGQILRRDQNFSWFLAARILSQFGMMGMSFYVVYAVRFLGMSGLESGLLTSTLFITQVISNPLLGRLADLTSRRGVLLIGMLAAAGAAAIATVAANPVWFYPVVILGGISNTAFWTIAIAFSLEFGKTEREKPIYVGMANTLIAPAGVIAPLLGGWIADKMGYSITFAVACIFSLLAGWFFFARVREPHSMDSIPKGGII